MVDYKEDIADLLIDNISKLRHKLKVIFIFSNSLQTEDEIKQMQTPNDLDELDRNLFLLKIGSKE